jgi:hypothetical protein
MENSVYSYRQKQLSTAANVRQLSCPYYGSSNYQQDARITAETLPTSLFSCGNRSRRAVAQLNKR